MAENMSPAPHFEPLWGYRDVGVGPLDVRPWLSEMPVSFATLFGLEGDKGYRPYIEYRRLSEFKVRDRNSLDNGGILTFRRHGLGWKLEAMQWGQQ